MSYDKQCSSCGGFCGRGGCKRENVKPEPEPVAWITDGGQAGVALRYLSLLAEQHPEVDVSPLVRELRTLFDLR